MIIWSAMERKNLLHQHLTQKLTKTRPKDMVLLGMKPLIKTSEGVAESEDVEGKKLKPNK